MTQAAVISKVAQLDAQSRFSEIKCKINGDVWCDLGTQLQDQSKVYVSVWTALQNGGSSLIRDNVDLNNGRFNISG